MPEQETIRRAKEDAREGKAPSTQTGEFVEEEMDHIREGKHGARSTKQAIAIGLSKARRAGVDLPPPKADSTSERTRKQAALDSAKGKAASRPKPSATRSRATKPRHCSAKETPPHRVTEPAGKSQRAQPWSGRPASRRTQSRADQSRGVKVVPSNRWSQRVTKTPASAAKAGPLQSAMSMLNFYLNRAGKTLPEERKKYSAK